MNESTSGNELSYQNKLNQDSFSGKFLITFLLALSSNIKVLDFT